MPLLALRAAYKLPYTGYKQVARRNRFFVVVHSHIKRLYPLGVVRQKQRSLCDLLTQKTLVLRFQVKAPLDRIFEAFSRFLKLAHRFGVRHLQKFAVADAAQL